MYLLKKKHALEDPGWLAYKGRPQLSSIFQSLPTLLRHILCGGHAELFFKAFAEVGVS